MLLRVEVVQEVPRRRLYCTSVCPSVCPVVTCNSRMEGGKKFAFGVQVPMSRDAISRLRGQRSRKVKRPHKFENGNDDSDDDAILTCARKLTVSQLVSQGNV